MSTDPSGPDALTRRIEQLAAYEADEGDGAAANLIVSTIRGEIGAVRAELGSLRSEVGAVRTDLDGLGGRLTGSVAASRSETGTLVRRIAELAARVDGVGGRVDDVRNGLPGLSREVRETLGQVPQRSDLDAASAGLREALNNRLDDVAADVRRSVATALEQEAQSAASTQSSLVDARGALEARLAVLEDTLDAMTERLESLARDGARTTTARLAELAAGVSALERRVEEQGREAAELLVGRLRDVTETRMAELENTLYDRLSMVLRARTEELRDDVVSALERTSEESTQSRAAVGELADSVSRGLDGFGAVLDRSLTGLGGSVSSAIAEGRAQSRSDLDDVANRMAGTVTSLQDDLGRRAEQSDERLGALRSGVEERLEALRGQVVAALNAARSDVATEVGLLRPQVADLTAASHAQVDAFSSLRMDIADAVEGLRERVTAVTTESAASVREALGETRTEVAERTRALRDEVTARVEQVFAGVVDRLGDLAADVTSGTAATRASTERLASLVSASDDVRRTLDEVRSDVAGSTEAMRTALVASAEQQFAALGERLAAVAATVDSSAGDTRELQERATALTDAAMTFRTELEQALDVVRDEVVEASRDLRKELLTKTAGQAADVAKRLAALTTTVDRAQGEVAEKVGALDAAVGSNTLVTEQAAEDVAAVVESTDVLGGIVGGFRKEWPTRTFEVVQGAKAVAEMTVGEVRQEVARKLDEVAQALDRALGGVDKARTGIDSGTKRLSAAGQVLVAYLEQRDRLLEAERDRILHEVLDQFGAGLSARERAALTSRMGDAVSRRRDSRDAERYRAAVGEPVSPVVELPDDVTALVPPPPPASDPTRPDTQRGPAARPGPTGRLGGALHELSADDERVEEAGEVPTGRAFGGSTGTRRATTSAGPRAGGPRAGEPSAAGQAAAGKPGTRRTPTKKATKAATKKAPARKPPARGVPAPAGRPADRTRDGGSAPATGAEPQRSHADSTAAQGGPRYPAGAPAPHRPAPPASAHRAAAHGAAPAGTPRPGERSGASQAGPPRPGAPRGVPPRAGTAQPAAPRRGRVAPTPQPRSPQPRGPQPRGTAPGRPVGHRPAEPTDARPARTRPSEAGPDDDTGPITRPEPPPVASWASRPTPPPEPSEPPRRAAHADDERRLFRRRRP